MKHIVLLLLISTTVASAQTKVSGRVTDSKGAPIPLANIILVNTYDGTTADEQGNFEFETSESGLQTLSISMIGYREFLSEIVIGVNHVHIDAVLEEAISELKAVTISAGSFTASDESRRTVFKAIDIATTAGATADIAGALNTLPGTTKVGESGRLFVRGGEGNETRTFIDGMVAFDAYSPSAPNTPSRGRFLPFMFKGTSFSTGGYSAEFGQALSSALVLDSKDNSEITRTDFGLLSVGADVTHTQAWDKGSMSGKLQYTNLRPYVGIISQEVDWIEAPASLEAIGALRQRVGKQGMVKLYGNFNNSDFALKQHDIDDYSITQDLHLQNNYRYGNASYRFPLNSNWSIRGGLSYASVKNDTKINDIVINESEKSIHKKTVIEGSLNESIELKAGSELLDRNYVLNDSANFRETISGTFAEADIYATNNFVARIGGRAEYSSLTEKMGYDPRISLAVRTNENGQLSLAYGTFRQSPENKWLRSRSELKAEKSTHYIMSYQHSIAQRILRIETYYKAYNDLVKFDGNNPGQLSNDGHGYAKGLELFWRDNESIDGFDYWISYSLLDTKRLYLDYPFASTPTFASKHNFSLVGKYFFTKLKSQVGTTLSYASGRPYFNPNHDRFLSDRTKSYGDFSINWSYLPTPSLIVYVSCTNVAGRNNIFGYEYSRNVNEDGFYNSRAITQPAPRFLFVGVFLTLSKDKSVNQLPTL